jgi:DNA-binding transcriptional LysR family regulator
VVDYTAENHFYALADELRINIAARRCGVTRQTILESLEIVESRYGARLCRFEGKYPSLTNAGRRLRDSIREAGIESHYETVSVMEDPLSEHGVSNWLKIAAGQLWPSMSVQVLKGDYQQALMDPNTNYFDLALLFGWPQIKHPDLEYTKLYDQEINAFAAQHAFDPEATPTDLKTFRLYPHLIPSISMPGLQDLLLWEARKVGCVPVIKAVRNKRDFLSLIQSGSSIGFAPMNILSTVPSTIVRVRYEPRMTIPFVVVHRKHEASRAVHRLLNLACRLTDAGAADQVVAELSRENLFADQAGNGKPGRLGSQHRKGETSKQADITLMGRSDRFRSPESVTHM